MVETQFLNRESRRMQPMSRLIKLISSTGAGKTELTKYFAAKSARPIIGRCVGRTNSTITPRTLVFTESEDILIVATKKKVSYIEVTWFDNQIINIFSEFIYQYSNKKKIAPDEMMTNLQAIVRKYLKPKNNVASVITLIDETILEDIINQITTIFMEKVIKDNVVLKISANAQANIDPRDQRYNPDKYKKLIRNEVERVFETTVNKIIQDEFRDVFNELNNILDRTYESSFQVNSFLSSDDYYTKEFDLTNLTIEDNEFISRLFDNNEVTNGKKVSIETLCKEIVIYLPMNNVLLDEFNSPRNKEIKENFIDSSGKLSFAITDTMGLFHKGTSDDDNDMYLSDLMYGERCDAIVFLAPLAGDTNGIKLKNAYEKVITNFSLDTPIIVINNKADIFLDQERKNQEDIDIDDIDISDEIDTFNINNIMNMIDKEVSNFNVKLVSSQHKKRTGNDIKSYAVYLKRTKDMDKAFVTKYHPQIMAFGIMNTISKYVGESSEKISFHLKNGYTDIEFDFKEKILTNIFSNHLNKPEYRTKVFNPVQTDIENNLNVIPHGQSYYKLKRNIARGQGSVSQIDESRFKNVSSFAIKFPGNLKNLITAEFIWEVIDKALIIEGGVFEDINEAKKKLYDILLDCSNGYQKGYFKQENFTAKLLYDRTLIPAEKFGMTFGSKFQKFLEVVSEDINNIDKDVKKYEEALKDAMIEPLYLIASRSIRYI